MTTPTTMPEDKKKRKRVLKPKITCDYRVKRYEDGKYHWMYDLNMLKNPAVLIDLYVALGMAVFIVACIMFLIMACSSGLHLEELGFVLKITGLMVGIMLVLGILGYLLYAALSGWVYTVHFIMDEDGVVHQQAPRAEKLAKRLGCLTALAGLATGRPGVMGAGMMGAGRTSMSSEFNYVRKVKAIRWMNTIQVNERLGKNRVYVSDEDFDFVYNYICSHCPNAKIS